MLGDPRPCHWEITGVHMRIVYEEHRLQVNPDNCPATHCSALERYANHQKQTSTTTVLCPDEGRSFCRVSRCIRFATEYGQPQTQSSEQRCLLSCHIKSMPHVDHARIWRSCLLIRARRTRRTSLRRRIPADCRKDISRFRRWQMNSPDLGASGTAFAIHLRAQSRESYLAIREMEK